MLQSHARLCKSIIRSVKMGEWCSHTTVVLHGNSLMGSCMHSSCKATKNACLFQQCYRATKKGLPFPIKH